MIRFACPDCAATFSVGDNMAGKLGKCPKCQSQFTIPEMVSPENDRLDPPPIPAPPVPEPPADDPIPPIPETETPVEIAPCPGCGSKLSVMPSDLGLDVECPKCKTQYEATRLGDWKPPAPSKSPKNFERPSQRKPAEDDEEDERPSKRSKRRDDDEEDKRPRRLSKYPDDDYEGDDRDYRRKKKLEKPGTLQAVQIMLLVGGIESLLITAGWILGSTCFCLVWPGVYYGIVYGIMAIVRASQMLGKNDRSPPPKTLCIMAIICIVNGDLINMILGIIGLVLLNNEDVQRYYSRQGRR